MPISISSKNQMAFASFYLIFSSWFYSIQNCCFVVCWFQRWNKIESQNILEDIFHLLSYFHVQIGGSFPWLPGFQMMNPNYLDSSIFVNGKPIHKWISTFQWSHSRVSRGIHKYNYISDCSWHNFEFSFNINSLI